MGQDEKDTEVGVVGRGRSGGWEIKRGTRPKRSEEAV